MPHIAIVVASVRTGRKSNRVAIYLKHFIEERNLATVEMLDLLAYNFPIFNERLKYQKTPSETALDFANRIKTADGVIIVTPEYNGGYPSSLKNAIDLLTTEWNRKPVAISTSSDGVFGGTQVIVSIQFTLWKMRAWTVPAMLPMPRLDEILSEEGVPADKETLDKRTSAFVQELLWCIEAKSKMEK